MQGSTVLSTASLILNVILLYNWIISFESEQYFSTAFSRSLKLPSGENETDDLSIRILIYRASHGGKNYAPARDSIHCYAKIAGHELLDVDLDNDQIANSTCAEFSKDKFFQRHCVLAEYLKIRSDITHALAIDGDVGVVNFTKKIEKFIDPYASITFPVRFRTMEIAACSFIVKNDAYGREFLMEWAHLNAEVPSVGFSNSDNGALLIHVLKHRSIAYPEYSMCFRRWHASESYFLYVEYMNCVSTFLGAPRKQQRERVKILRRGHSWIRDSMTTKGYWCEHDFFIHAMKSEIYNFSSADFFTPYAEEIKVDECSLGQLAPNIVMKSKLQVSCDKMRKKLSKCHFDLPNFYSHADNDLQCWPHCDEDH